MKENTALMARDAKENGVGSSGLRVSGAESAEDGVGAGDMPKLEKRRGGKDQKEENFECISNITLVIYNLLEYF